MKKLLVAGALALGAAACAPEINDDPLVAAGPTANFDPSAVPPVVPSPNELALSKTTGRNVVTVPDTASAVDKAFAEYLATLDGFPAGSSASATFSAPLDAASVQGSVRVVDLAQTGGGDVTNTVTVVYAEPPAAPAPRVTVLPPATGWKVNNRYGVVFTNGMKGADGKKVEPSATWVLVRSSESLVSCPNNDLTSADCRPTTGLIPSTETDPTKRAADVRAKALALETLRLLYKPLLDTAGVPRDQVVLAWTFKTASNPGVAFDPGASRIPTPTDLVISGLGTANQKVAVPVTKTADGGYANANDEFNDTYLNTLDGFPSASTGSAPVVGGVKLNASTVSAQTVVVLNITNPAAPTPCGSACTVSAGTGAGNTTSAIEVRRTGGWPKGSRWAVAVTKGVRDEAGASVEPSTVTWQLVRSTSPIATCENLATATGCTVNFKVSALTDAEAARLETLRLGYAPLFTGLAAAGVQRNNVAVMWTFSIMTQSEMVLDLASGALPFPVTIPGFTTAADGGVQVALPAPAPLPDGGVNQSETALVQGLNTLDGFSPSAPIVAENSATLPAIDGTSDLDLATFKAPASAVLRLGAAQPGGLSNTQPDIVYVFQSPAGQPNTVAWAPRTPLDERTRYLVYTTNDVKTANGKALAPSTQFALLRLKNPLRDANGNSTVSVVPSANAAQFEALRQYWNAAVFAPLESAAVGIPRAKLVHAFPFHTLSTVSQLVQLRQAGLNPALPNAAPTLADVTAEVVGAMTATGLPTAGVGKVFYGTYASPYLLTGPGGAFNPAVLAGQQSPRVDLLPFLMFVPAGAAPTGGYELTVFGHGLGSNLSNALAIASRMNTEGRIVVATDWAQHGERTICVGAASTTASTTDTDNDFCTAGSTCNADANSPRFGRCLATDAASAADCNPSANGDLTCARARQGRCIPSGATTGKCEGGDFVRPGDPGPGLPTSGLPLSKPAVSGWNFFSATNPFATRDNFRQHIVDLTALARVLRHAQFNAQLDAVNGGDVPVNVEHFDYAGISLGGILGTTFTAASDVRRAGLNVPGGDLFRIVIDGESFAAQKAALLAGLGLTEGTPAFARFENIFRWVLDPADPVNAAHVMRNRTAPALPAGRDALVQYITGDQTVPNTNTVKLILAGRRENPIDVACWNPGTPAPASRHGFLLNFADATVTAQAQIQLVDYLNTGTVTAQATQGSCPAALPQ